MGLEHAWLSLITRIHPFKPLQGGNWELYSTGIVIASGSFSDEEQWAAVAPVAALPADPVRTLLGHKAVGPV